MSLAPASAPPLEQDPSPPPARASVPDRALEWLHRMPLRVRLIAILLTLLLVALTLTSAASALLVRRELIARVDDNLDKAAVSLSDSITEAFSSQTPKTRTPSGYAVIVFDAEDGSWMDAVGATTVEALPDIDEMTFDDARVSSGRPFTVGTDGSNLTWRAIAGTDDFGAVTFVIAQPLADVTKTVQRLIAMAALIGLGLMFACAALGWFAVRRAFRPLSEIEDTAAAIAGGDFSRRVPDNEAPAEVSSLTDSFNVMLAHVESALGARADSQERMREFVADASHELRTPLATVRGYAELYRHGAVAPDAVPATMNRIETEASRMAQLVDDLLLLARLDEERPVEFADIDLTVVAAEAVQAARVRDPERRIVVHGLTGAIGPVLIRGAADGLHQVLGNLLTNAIRYTPAGTPIEVAVGHADGGRTAVVEVRDHGPGIDEKARARVFERFFREDKARSRASGGTGLGLAIVAAIVARHTGRVGIKATPGGGATFVVEVPALPLTANSQE